MSFSLLLTKTGVVVGPAGASALVGTRVGTTAGGSSRSDLGEDADGSLGNLSGRAEGDDCESRFVADRLRELTLGPGLSGGAADGDPFGSSAGDGGRAPVAVGNGGWMSGIHRRSPRKRIDGELGVRPWHRYRRRRRNRCWPAERCGAEGAAVRHFFLIFFPKINPLP